jgi:uncharacterized protein (DUF2267 family)
MTLRTIRRLAVLLIAVAVLRLATSPHARAALARGIEQASHRLRYWSGRLQGLAYRLRDRHPDPDVAHDVLADRIRSTLGPLEKRLDVPKVHVSVADHVASLHGHVPTHDDAARLERAVAGISGVSGVESYLTVEAVPDAQLPSGGGRHPGPSAARKRLADAAYAAGAPDEITLQVVSAVLGFLAQHVPADELDQFAAHLPDDVRTLCRAPRRTGRHRVRTVAQLVAELAPATAPLSPDAARHVIEAVFGTLRDLVPEEDHDVAATLPDELREYWLASMPH